MLGFWLLFFLMAALILAMPWWPYSREWGYWPGTGFLMALLIWLGLIWLGYILFAWPWAPLPPPSP